VRGRVALLPLILILLTACAAKVPFSGDGRPRSSQERQAEREGVFHTVAVGETWADIARNYYGDSDGAKRLEQANPAAGEALEQGEEIFVPLTKEERDEFVKRARTRAPYNLGLAHARAGEYPEAIIQFHEALRLDAEFAPAEYNLGLAYRRAGKPRLAEEALSRAVRLDGERADYRYALGLIRLDRGDVPGGAACFRAALERDGNHLAAIYALARQYEIHGRPDLALDLWRRYLVLDPDSSRGQEARRYVEQER
jgi:tetratricopeptide (TPR) repeat protein